MSKKQKDPASMNEDEAYIEAQRRINECRSKNGKELSFPMLINLREIPPEIIDNNHRESEFICNKAGKKKRGIPRFNEMTAMSHRYRQKLLETCSIKQIETFLCSAPRYCLASENDKELFRQIMNERCHRLNRRFKWTDENKERIARVSDEFIRTWEDGFAKAKIMIDALYEKKQNKDSFNDKYGLEITLYPDIIGGDDENEECTSKIYDAITGYLDPRVWLNMNIEYDPVTKSEENFRRNQFIFQDKSWNCLGFGDEELADYYICYAMYILYNNSRWAFEDILKINNISPEIKVSYCNEIF